MPSKEFHESREEMESILREESIGYLGLSVDGQPYVVPLNYGYVAGKILFHGAMTGKKLDYLKANPQVCFTVGRQSGRPDPHPQDTPCPIETDSVICYGTARIIEDVEERRAALTTFSRCLQPDASEITLEAAAKCCAVEIKVTEMTGRRQRDKEKTYWCARFEE